MRIVGYTRLSTAGRNGESGHGLDAQQAAIVAAVAANGWTLVDWYTDPAASGREMRNRPGLLAALECVETDCADGLVVAKLDRLSRSTVDAGRIFERATRKRWTLVALDLGIDTSTSTGRLVANLMVSVGQWERERIGERTREGLAAARAKGKRLGRPRECPEQVVARIMHAHEGGQEGFSAIAAALMRDHVPTPRGGSLWHPSTVARIVAAEQRREVA